MPVTAPGLAAAGNLCRRHRAPDHLLQRIPVVGKIVRFAFSLGLLAFLIFILLQQAPYKPTLARIADTLGLDDQQVSGGEVHVRMSSDGHFWVKATINGVPRRMLIDSGATVTALSEETARVAHVASGSGTLAPVILRTANGMAPARTGSIDELRVGNIVARNLRMVTAPGLTGLDVLGMNFLSQAAIVAASRTTCWSWSRTIRSRAGRLKAEALFQCRPCRRRAARLDEEGKMRLNYAIKFVGDMSSAVAFYRDALAADLALRIAVLERVETGATTLALHPASPENPAGTMQLGLGTEDIDNFYSAGQAEGLVFTSPPTDVHGTRIARFRDPDGAEISVSAA